jgi:hypothetical protein
MNSTLLMAMAPIALLLVLLIIFLVMYVRLQRGAPLPVVRPLPAVDALRSLTERAIEEGRATHIALGTGTLAGENAAETLVGLTAMSHLADQARRANQIPVVTTADPAVQLLAGDVLAQDESTRQREARDYARFVAPQAIGYGVGTRALMQEEQLGLTAVLGDIGDEYLYLAATHPGGGQHFYPPEVAGTTRPETLPLVQLTARNPLLGEELFAYGAYLGKTTQQWAGVMLQDVGRLLLIVMVLVGAIVATVMGFL